MKKGTLYLIPNTLGGTYQGIDTTLLKEIILSIDVFVIEEIRSARRLLRGLGYTEDFENVTFNNLNEHSKDNDIEALLDPIFSGKNIGIISEAGLPCVADPGAQLVAIAHQKNVRVVPLSGPSSILMTLISSGLNGQSFTFHGYLPKDRSERIKRLKTLEQFAKSSGYTQLFMDAPYRNKQVLEDIIENISNHILLCIAVDLTTTSERIQTMSIGEWKKSKLPEVQKVPVMFAIGTATFS